MNNDFDASTKKRKLMDRTEASVLLLELDSILDSARAALDQARTLATTAELDSSRLSDTAISHSVGASSTTATAGHSNTDHIIRQSGDAATDRFHELKRKYIRRIRSTQPETRGNDRWDKPKIPGERRRRIVRDKDSPDAPAEPPPSGYTIFVGQMTTKIRHDRPHEPHNQTRVVQEISGYWNSVLTDAQRDDYNVFSDQARLEYAHQLREYRATGTYTPSETFEKKPHANVWVRKRGHEKNALERELDNYETYSFRPRPAELDEAYQKREEQSKIKRKLKLKGLQEKKDGILDEEEHAAANEAEQIDFGEETTHDEVGLPTAEDEDDDEPLAIVEV